MLEHLKNIEATLGNIVQHLCKLAEMGVPIAKAVAPQYLPEEQLAGIIASGIDKGIDMLKANSGDKTINAPSLTGIEQDVDNSRLIDKDISTTIYQVTKATPPDTVSGIVGAA